MTSREIIQDRAIRMGIATGDMPEVEFIWRIQEAEGHQPCFGQSEDCQSPDCRWREACRALNGFEDEVLAGAGFRGQFPRF